MGTKRRLKVIKADGSIEEYLHTKVMGAIGNALAEIGQADVCVAEELADVVTYFLYNNKKHSHTVTSGEILSIVKAVLTATGYEEAAVELSEYHFERKLKRSRIEVIPIDIQGFTDIELFGRAEESGDRSAWDKSKIVADLAANYGLSRQTARMVASMVEEKVFNMQITQVPVSLIRQLVLGDTAAVLRAQKQLETV